MDSVVDKVLNKVLIDEVRIRNLEALASFYKGLSKEKEYKDAVLELFYRNIHRSSKFYKIKAEEVLGLGSTMDEAKRYIK